MDEVKIIQGTTMNVIDDQQMKMTDAERIEAAKLLNESATIGPSFLVHDGTLYVDAASVQTLLKDAGYAQGENGNSNASTNAHS